MYKGEITMEYYTKEFGSWVKMHRVKANISQEELAERCGLSARQIYNVESGRCEPRLSTILKICFSCGMNFDNFITDYLNSSHSEKL